MTCLLLCAFFFGVALSYWVHLSTVKRLLAKQHSDLKTLVKTLYTRLDTRITDLDNKFVNVLFEQTESLVFDSLNHLEEINNQVLQAIDLSNLSLSAKASVRLNWSNAVDEIKQSFLSGSAKVLTRDPNKKNTVEDWQEEQDRFQHVMGMQLYLYEKFKGLKPLTMANPSVADVNNSIAQLLTDILQQ